MNPTSSVENVVEHILWHDQPLAYIIRADPAPVKTTFLTPPGLNSKLVLLFIQQAAK